MSNLSLNEKLNISDILIINIKKFNKIDIKVIMVFNMVPIIGMRN